ncbi:hypothetical protein AVEN_203309-1 [Araneus ventricosus]|uniref:Uncharacterized protein n=1 Tax=Araneus ventricosus TaxID=182803 RepID=A0A4Y2WM11_ARAVE|nr:hypothetical protein AVEN_203309-1 [Araneus ventricosus]
MSFRLWCTEFGFSFNRQIQLQGGLSQPRVTNTLGKQYLLPSYLRKRKKTLSPCLFGSSEAVGRRIYPTTVRRPPHNGGFYARSPFLCARLTSIVGMWMTMLSQ